MTSTSSGSSVSFSSMEKLQELHKKMIELQKKNPADGLQITEDIVNESSKVIENSTSSTEMILDATILQGGTTYVNSNVSSLNASLTRFNDQIYISGILNYMNNTNQIFSPEKKWECFGLVTYHNFKKSHPLTFMLGTFALEPPPPKERVKVERQKKTNEPKKQVMKVVNDKEETIQEEGSDIYNHILKQLKRKYKKSGKQPVSYIHFIIDPNDYWRTIENIFHFAFLVRDGNVKMKIKEGLPFIEPVLDSRQEKENTEFKHQFCFSLSKSQWKECIKNFKIESPGIPHFTGNF